MARTASTALRFRLRFSLDGSPARPFSENKDLVPVFCPYASNNGFPSYSPDGKKKVLRWGRDGAKNLYIMDRDGQNVRRLTKGAWTDTMCDWSPTGEGIAFASDRDDNKERRDGAQGVQALAISAETLHLPQL